TAPSAQSMAASADCCSAYLPPGLNWPSHLQHDSGAERYHLQTRERHPVRAVETPAASHLPKSPSQRTSDQSAEGEAVLAEACRQEQPASAAPTRSASESQSALTPLRRCSVRCPSTPASQSPALAPSSGSDPAAPKWSQGSLPHHRQ